MFTLGPTLRSLCVSLLLLGCQRSDPDVVQSTTPEVQSFLEFDGPPPKNLLFISVDTLRKDHLGAYGELGLSPFLDRIADEGVVMTDHQQCSNWTLPTTTCTLAGRSNLAPGSLFNPLDGVQDPSTAPTLASWLTDAGYLTVLSTANDYFSIELGNSGGYLHEGHAFGLRAPLVHARGMNLLEMGIEQGHTGPWFLHLHHFEPHQPYNPPSAFTVGEEDLEPWVSDLRQDDATNFWSARYLTLEPAQQDLLAAHLNVLYQGEVRLLDRGIENYWTQLERDGWLDDTLVVVWSDHGEQFFEHGFRGHAFQLYGEESDGVLMFWSKNIKSGRYDGPTAAIDVVPTVLHALQLPQPPEVTGQVIGSAAADRPRFAESTSRLGYVQSVTKGGFKMQYSWSLGVVKVYDRVDDPLEQTDVFDPEDPMMLEMWSLLKPKVHAMNELRQPGDEPPIWPADLP